MISQVYFDKVKAHFDGDETKTWVWFETLHPAFGLFTPMTMIKIGREKKVMDYIDRKLGYDHI